jgi:hypothetical protein
VLAAISGREIELTTAALALEEQRAATTVEHVTAPTVAVAPIASAAVTAPRASGLILGVLLLVQAGWIGTLGYVAYKLF